ncbi:unnamed protein product [Lota lota]
MFPYRAPNYSRLCFFLFPLVRGSEVVRSLYRPAAPLGGQLVWWDDPGATDGAAELCCWDTTTKGPPTTNHIPPPVCV